MSVIAMPLTVFLSVLIDFAFNPSTPAISHPDGTVKDTVSPSLSPALLYTCSFFSSKVVQLTVSLVNVIKSPVALILPKGHVTSRSTSVMWPLLPSMNVYSVSIFSLYSVSNLVTQLFISSWVSSPSPFP